MNLNDYLSMPDAPSGAKFAEMIGVPPPLISQWRSGVRQVPAERCPDIEKESKGCVTCEELRPDLAEKFAYLRGSSSKVPA
jgi:DNA-binding transcriptional regulator YdaS (Cro superfamily)